MATTYLEKTFGSDGNRDKWTYSVWIKRSGIGVATALIGAATGSDFENITLRSSDDFDWEHYASSTYKGRLLTNRKFRDPGAWMHIVCVWDSANVTGGDRMKLYVNGVEETSFATDTNPTSGQDSLINSTAPQQVGNAGSGSQFFDGAMAHAHFCDGYAYAASDFGETDSTSGIWVPISAPSVSYGSNGYFLKFQDTSAFGDDSSGNTNDFAVGAGTITQTQDTPVNNFCTANPLDNYYASITYTNGNTTATSSTPYGYSRATQGVSAGLWYWEVKATTISAPDYVTGVASTMSTGATIYPGKNAGSWSYVATDGNSKNDGTGTSYGDTYSAGDIIGVYLDLTANKLYFAKNGTVQNSGTGISITAPASTDDGVYAATAGVWSATGGTVSDFNFGNGYFGTTAVTSAVADAGGIGQFEYDPSAGTFDGSSKDFRAICTNNIATYG